MMSNLLPLFIAGGAAFLVIRKAKKKKPRRRKSPTYTGTIRIGLFKGAGAHHKAVDVASNFLDSIKNVEFSTFNTNDVLNGRLDNLDIVFFPGGSGSRQGKSLGGTGREAVRNFVKSGGGYIGICAGSYLAAQGDHSELNLVNFTTGPNWKRGEKDVLVEADVKGRPIQFMMHYENGPIFEPTDESGIPAYVPLGVYLGESYSTNNNTHKGEMIGTPVITASKYGEGRVLLFSPNPMLGARDALQFSMFIDAMRWVMTKGPVPPDLMFEEVFPSKIT